MNLLEAVLIKKLVPQAETKTEKKPITENKDMAAQLNAKIAALKKNKKK
jgi:hypothetical protein